MIRPGEMAPLFKATAVPYNRSFSLQAWRNQPLLLLFVDYRTAPQTQEVARALRREYPRHTDVLLAIVVNLQFVPGSMRKIVRSMLGKIIHETARQLPADVDPADHLIVIPDWQGQISRVYGLGELSKVMGVVMIDGNSRVHAAYQGPQPAQAILGWAKDYFSGK